MMVEREEIAAAHERIRPHVRETPMINLAGGTLGIAHALVLKLELLQHTGSFKPRGAFNNLLSRTIPKAGVVAASGGNHGIAVAFAAGRLGIPAQIFVPTVASAVKVARIRSYGATVTVEGDRYADAKALAEAHQIGTGAVGVHAYDSVETVAGQGSVAREWEGQSPDLDTILVAVGGGGLIGGIAAWFGDKTKVIGVEPEISCCLHAALKAGKPVDVSVEGVAADSLGARSVGAIPFAIARTFVADVLLVSDAAIGDAQSRLWNEMRLATEPGGAAAMAALTSGIYRPAEGERVGVLVCGGNVDLTVLNSLAAG
jgi:threonine dehydratase